MAWDYQREEGFEQVPVGKHRIRVKEVEKTQSKAGNDMLKLTFQVSGMNNLLFHYIVFMEDHKDVTNRMLTNFFDSFKDIKDGDFVLANWVGKIGACMVAVDKNDDSRTRISYFIKADKQDDLPAWVEPQNSKGTVTESADGFVDMSKIDDVPFM